MPPHTIDLRRSYFTRSGSALSEGATERIEKGILLKSPNVYNALKPIDWPAIAAPEPHVCRPVKSRSGRPKKIDPADPASLSSLFQEPRFGRAVSVRG